MNKIKLFSNKVELATADNGNLLAKFILCDFNTNLNGVRLDRASIEDWMDTIIHQPLVGKIVQSGFTGEPDFSGHNMKIVSLEDGTKRAEFDTDAYGSFVSVAIEEIEGAEYLVATAEIWARYPRVIELIAERVETSTLNSSWEIMVEESYMDGNDKVIKSGTFTAHALLGKNHTPAYACSRLLEVAEDDTEFDEEILSAIIEASEANDEILDVEPNQPVEEPTVSALTDHDIVDAINRELYKKHQEDHGTPYVVYHFPETHEVWARDWCMPECEFYRYTYEIINDAVVISDPESVELIVEPKAINSTLSIRDEALNQANLTIQSMQSEIETLRVYKDEHDRIEEEKLAQMKEHERSELKAYALRSGHITEQELSENESIKLMIESVDMASIKQLIAERFMTSLNTVTQPIEVASDVRVSLEDDESELHGSIAMLFANKKKK